MKERLLVLITELVVLNKELEKLIDHRDDQGIDNYHIQRQLDRNREEIQIYADLYNFMGGEPQRLKDAIKK